MRVVLAVLVIATACLAACGESSGAPTTKAAEQPAGDPYVIGVVTTVTPFAPVTDRCVEPDPGADPDEAVSSDDLPACSDPSSALLGTVLIEEDPGEPNAGAKVSFRVERDAVILIERGGAFRPGGFDDLVEGRLVSAWTTRPVAESYPAQGVADAIVIHG